jgi:hypothetical protein
MIDLPGYGDSATWSNLPVHSTNDPRYEPPEDMQKLAQRILRMPPAAEPPKDVRLKACIDVCAFTAPDDLGRILFDLLYSDGVEQAEQQLRAAVQDRT